MNKINITKIKNKLYELEEVRSLVNVSKKNGILNEIVMGVSSYENLDLYIKAFIEDGEILISKLKNYFVDEDEIISYKYIDYNKKIIELYFIKNENIFNFISDNEENVIIFDKDRILKDLSKEKTDSNWVLPKEDEFIEEIVDFLFNLLEIAINYKNKNYIKASLLKNDMVDYLIYMLNCYISLKYTNHVFVDQYGSGLKDYLENDMFKEFEFIVSESVINDIWTIIFKSAQLYRTIGLYISENLGYTYPKREDVKTLNILREVYKEEE